jgi:hypothetical protein
MNQFQVLGFDVKKTGFTAALPPIICIFVKFIAGPISDKLVCLSDRYRIILFATLSQVCIYKVRTRVAKRLFLYENSCYWFSISFKI